MMSVRLDRAVLAESDEVTPSAAGSCGEEEKRTVGPPWSAKFFPRTGWLSTHPGARNSEVLDLLGLTQRHCRFDYDGVDR